NLEPRATTTALLPWCPEVLIERTCVLRPAVLAQVDPPADEHDAFRFELAPLQQIGVAPFRKGDAAARVDDAKPRNVLHARRAQHRTDEPCAPRQSRALRDAAVRTHAPAWNALHGFEYSPLRRRR